MSLFSPGVLLKVHFWNFLFFLKFYKVSTDDEVQGQFTIPGRGTFNVINPGGRPSSRGQSETPPTEGASGHTPEEQEDEEEWG